MKKYKKLKWLVLGIAIFAVICFFTPFVQEDTLLGFNFIIGTGFYGSKEDVVQTCVWLVRLSLVIAISAVVFSIIAIALKDADGLNKQGKLHKSLFISLGLSLLSAIVNLIVGVILVDQYDGFYTFIGLIVIGISTIVAVPMLLSTKTEIANAEAPTSETAFTQQQEPAIQQKDIEQIFALVWVRKFNELTFEEATDKILAYLAENNYIDNTKLKKRDWEQIIASLWIRKINELPFDEAANKILDYMKESGYLAEAAEETEQSIEKEETTTKTTTVEVKEICTSLKHSTEEVFNYIWDHGFITPPFENRIFIKSEAEKNIKPMIADALTHLRETESVLLAAYLRLDLKDISGLPIKMKLPLLAKLFKVTPAFVLLMTTERVIVSYRYKKFSCGFIKKPSKIDCVFFKEYNYLDSLANYPSEYILDVMQNPNREDLTMNFQEGEIGFKIPTKVGVKEYSDGGEIVLEDFPKETAVAYWLNLYEIKTEECILANDKKLPQEAVKSITDNLGASKALFKVQADKYRCWLVKERFA